MVRVLEYTISGLFEFKTKKNGNTRKFEMFTTQVIIRELASAV
jgi:hypothetical protein